MIRTSTATWTTLVALTVSVAAVFAAAAALAIGLGQSDRERQALIRFVCESVRIREETGDAAAATYRARFQEILADLGEQPCPPASKGVTP